MKEQFKLLIALCSFLANAAISQQSFNCGTLPGNTTSTTQIASYSSLCTGRAGGSYTVANNFLDDLIPKSADVTLTVNVNCYVFTPTMGVGYWNATTPTAGDFDYALFIANSIYQNTTTADYSIPGVAASPVNTKIKFVRKNFQIIANQAIYENYNLVIGGIYDDPNAINVYYVACSATNTNYVCLARTNTGGLGVKHVFYNADTIQNIAGTGPSLAHEFGHDLGLRHTFAGEGYSGVSLPESCCDSVFAGDTELLPWQVSSVGYPCGTAGAPNNLMSYNWACQKYLSPRQIAIMHYMLRTRLRDVLVPASYSYALNTNPAFDYTVTGTENWGYDRYMKGNVIVPANAKLNINCRVVMAGGGKIIIQKKGMVHIYGGIVTALPDRVWDGVQVEGNPNLDQTINSNGFALNQGLLKLEAAATLKNASTAARNYITDNNNNIIWNSTGGIIHGRDALFYDNARDVEFISYPNYPSGSYFEQCEFKTIGKIGGPYVPYAHVSLWNVYDVKFKGSVFQYSTSANYVGNEGYGIHSIDASYSVDYLTWPSSSYLSPCEFKNLAQGVRVDNSNPLWVASVNNSIFKDNEIDAAYFHNMNAFTFDNNTIQTPWYPINNGLYLNTCKYYTVKNNTLFKDQNTHNMGGMYITNSQDGAHQVYRNSFSGFGTALSCYNNNSGITNIIDGLKINCNDFTQNYNNMDVAVHGNGTGANAPTVMSKQGETALSLMTSTNVVRNKYAAPCSNASKWYTSLNSTKVVQHGTNSDAVTQPTPQPACSRTIVNVVQAPISLDYTAHCLSTLPSEGGSSNDPVLRLANINSYIRTLQAQGAAVNKFELQATVASKLNWYLKDKLPGSKDTVVNLLINNRGNMKDADIQLVFAYMRKNDYVNATTKANALPASRADWKALLLKLIAIYKEPNKIYSINTNTAAGYKTFLQGYANTAGKDGQHIAQSLLKFVSKINYTEPREYPNLAAGKETAENEVEGSIADALSVNYGIHLYPNPTFNGVTLVYNNEQDHFDNTSTSSAQGLSDQTALVEVKDLLGKVIYSNFISNESSTYISLESYTSGVYLITVTKDKQVLYKTKVIKQD